MKTKQAKSVVKNVSKSIVDTSQVNFDALMNAYDVSANMADSMLVLAYESDLIAHNSASHVSYIDNAQIKRNISADTSKTSLFCRLLESTKQNYRIDIALSEFHTMRELMQLTDCSEARIKSHMKYVDKNCLHTSRVINHANNKQFKYIVT